MSNPIITWYKDAPDGFFVNIAGLPDPTGLLWSGTIHSPSSKWQLTYPQNKIEGGPGGPWGNNYHFNFSGSISGKQIGGPLTFNTGGGAGQNFPGLPWGMRTGEIWNFQANGGSLNNWEGNAYITMNWASNPPTFATWRYNIDILVRKTS